MPSDKKLYAATLLMPFLLTRGLLLITYLHYKDSFGQEENGEEHENHTRITVVIDFQ